MKLETAMLAGGCFWCVEAIFQKIKGVVSVTPGYSGGITPNPTYEEVSTGETEHAETAEIKFDPNVISYKDLLRILFLIHDPTTLNQQGGDVGTQYRSAIFFMNEEQKLEAEEVKAHIETEKIYKDPIVTEITEFKKFYPAEDYHQNFYNHNRDYPYCRIVIDPKINKLKKEFLYKLKTDN